MIVGALGTAGRARVDDRGAVAVVGEAWTLDWWIGADDRWRVPAREVSVRQGTLGAAPVTETRMRVPGGDAVQRVYGIGGRGDVVVVEIENDSPAAFVVGLVVRGGTSLAVDGSEVRIDGRIGLVVPFAPPRWDVTDVEIEPEGSGAQRGPVRACELASATLRAVFLYPLSHRNRIRIGVVCGAERPRLDLAQVPTADAAARGWRRQLERGMRVVGAVPGLDAIDRARAEVLLDPDPDPTAVAALEDWGFDEEATWAWEGLSGRDRRTARRRVGLRDDVGAAGLLLRARDAYVRDVDDGVELLRAPPPPGIDMEVHDAPTRHGVVSYALRWHGERPALLWEVRDAPDAVELRAPVLGPGWSTLEPTGETLLAGPDRG